MNDRGKAKRTRQAGVSQQQPSQLAPRSRLLSLPEARLLRVLYLVAFPGLPNAAMSCTALRGMIRSERERGATHLPHLVVPRDLASIKVGVGVRVIIRGPG